MTGNEYQKVAMRMATEKCKNIYNVALGLNGEAGEFADKVKKQKFQGMPENKDSLIEELEDIVWYIALGAETLGVALKDVFKINIDKLCKRYPNGFETERSLHRADRG